MSWLLDFLQQLTDLEVSLTDLADIITVTVLFYGLLVLLRSTRGMQMLWGIAIIAGLYVVAEALDLITLSKVLSGLLVFLPFAIIVLFQQEIRRMLSAFGSTAWMHLGGGIGEGQLMLNELSLAVQAMARNRVGCLICIERGDSLASWADTGIPLEARFSYDLLLNIFIPGTPLHDGAVIIRGGRLAAASCFLPLSQRHLLSSELGTRHRAAIGLSEETDALIIAASEETGTISLAVEGQLLRPLDETTLRNALAEYVYWLGPAEKGRS